MNFNMQQQPLWSLICNYLKKTIVISIHFDPIWFKTRSKMILFDPDLSKHTKMLHSVHVTASFQSYVHCIRRICRVANVRTRSLLCTISVSSLTGICSTAVPAQCWFSWFFFYVIVWCLFVCNKGELIDE